MLKLKIWLILSILCFDVQTACAFNRNLPISKNMPFADARRKLQADGWSPYIVIQKMHDGTEERSWGEAKRFKDEGILEIEFCSGIGKNYCTLNYKRKDSCLSIKTIGEYRPNFGSPRILSWASNPCVFKNH